MTVTTTKKLTAAEFLALDLPDDGVRYELQAGEIVSPRTAAILIVGDEILSADVPDENTPFLHD